MYQTHRAQLLALAFSALAALSLQAGTNTNPYCGGFRGVANFDQGLTLTPTANAPAHAKGKAQFLAVNDNGTNYEAVFVKTFGLTNGVFTVSLTDDTGTNTFNLGTLNVSSITRFDPGWFWRWWREHHRYDGPCWGDNEQNDEDRNEDGNHCRGEERCLPLSWSGGCHQPLSGWTNWVSECAGVYPAWTNLLHLGACTNLHCFATNACHWYTNTLTVGCGSFILPPGLSDTNAGVLTIADADGVVYLTGDFSSTTHSTVLYRETVGIVPGTATNAQGSATITYRQARAKTCGTFRLEASGLPPRTKLYLTADGAKTMKVFTRRDGTLKMRCFPRVNLATLSSVVATDTSSNVVFSVHF
jgi:hypothetical protein